MPKHEPEILQFKRQLSKYNRYNKSDLASVLREAVPDLPVVNTLNKWLNTGSFGSVNKVMRQFTETIQGVPQPELWKNVDLYKSILELADLDEESQAGLLRQDTTYKVMLPSDHQDKEKRFDSIAISGFPSAPYVDFFFRYKSASGQNVKARGIVIKRGDTNYILGIGSSTTVIGHAKDAEYPERSPTYGIMTFECIDEIFLAGVPFALINLQGESINMQVAAARTRLG